MNIRKNTLLDRSTWCSWTYREAHTFPLWLLLTMKSPSHLVLGHLYLHLTANHHNYMPATSTCLVHYNSVWCILSPRYQPQSSATLRSAKYAILSAEAPPKLPFCYNQTLSQSESVPAMPTCHHHSKPQDNLLGSRHMRRFIPKWDIHHVINKCTNVNKCNYLLQVAMQFHFKVSKNWMFSHTWPIPHWDLIFL